jgi:hypothetical protein
LAQLQAALAQVAPQLAVELVLLVVLQPKVVLALVGAVAAH